MITGTVDFSEYIVDYYYNYQKIVLKSIFKVNEYDVGKYESQLIEPKKLPPQTLDLITQKCNNDAQNKIILNHFL